MPQLQVSYTKLRNDNWGVRIVGDHGLKVRDVEIVTVVKKNGGRKEERVKVIWTGTDNRTGQPVALCAIETTGKTEES